MGQNSVQLPRRFVASNVGVANAHLNFEQVDSVANGMPFHWRRIFVPADYKRYLGDVNLYKQKIDNSRFTLFAREDSVFDPAEDYKSASGVENLVMQYGSSTADPAVRAPIYRQPTLWPYKEFSELIDLEVPTGFNSPQNIASSLTDQLKRPLKENIFTQRVYDDNIEAYEPVCTTVESATYKPFNAASAGHLTKIKYNNFISSISASQVSVESYDYLNNFQYVAHKRPQIQTTGRELPLNSNLPSRGTKTVETLDYADRHTATLLIDMEYNASNCALYNNFFNAQALYPELWDNLDPLGLDDFGGLDAYARDLIKVESSRWLHMNIFDDSVYTGAAVPYSILGGDNCDESGSMTSFDAPPVFFEYDSKTKDQFFESPSSDKLSYGCMDRVKTGSDPDVYKIKFYTAKVGGIPGKFYTEDTRTKLKAGRRIGFDIGFQAWSTCALAPFAGYNETAFEQNVQPGFQYVLNTATYEVNNMFDKLTQVYIRSVDPLIAYDSVSSRFKLSRLHTLLRQQQDFIAGRQDPKVDDITAEVAGAEVLKLNPKDNFYIYCPDLIPIRADTQHTGADNNEYTRLNMNLEPWLVYDSYSGIYIEDFGFDGDEGLWSVLGFTTAQFNATLSASNVISSLRIDNINKYQLNRVTTNAELTSKDYPAFIQNIFGANMFTQQIVSPLVVYDNNTTSQIGVNVFSAISLTQTSIEIVAENLPRRMLRPYYLLKSNIIDYNSLIGSKESGQNFNIAGIIDKQYSGGDFFFFTSNSIQFTITKPITLTSIQNSIHDPDGSFANINSDSSIIYKIEKTKNLQDLDVLNQILNKK